MVLFPWQTSIWVPAFAGMMGWTFPLPHGEARRHNAPYTAMYKRGKGPMNDISVIGIDLAKRIFELCALDAQGEVVWSKRLRRADFKKFMEEKAPRVLVGVEACGSAHYWCRWLQDRGFQVKMMAPRVVKAYLSGAHKNDARDARAIAESASRPYVRSVSVKSEEAQALQALVRIRDRLVKQRTQTANQLRSVLYEFGFILPCGFRYLRAGLAKLQNNPDFAKLPDMVYGIIEDLYQEIERQQAEAKRLNKKIAAYVEQQKACQRLMSIPHIGHINAALLSTILHDPKSFRNGRAFAAYLGLSPRQQASGEKSRILGISKHGSKELRRTLVLATQTLLTRLMRHAYDTQDRFLNWAKAMVKNKHRNVAAVAVANKLARIAWSVLAKEETYQVKTAG
jgi:transposase